MSAYIVHQAKEEKNRKRGFAITVFFHMALLGLAFSPLANKVQEIQLEEPGLVYYDLSEMNIIESTFTPNVETEARAGASQEISQESSAAAEEIQTEPVVEQVNSFETETLEDEETDFIETQEDVQETNNESTQDEVVEEVLPVSNQPAESTTDKVQEEDGGTALGNDEKPGDMGRDEDLQEGVFGRRVVFRPNIKGLVKEKGRVAIKVGVARDGKVIVSKYIRSLTTIKDPKLIAAAVVAAKRYRFDVDSKAPAKQWGKLTFIFDIK